MKTSVSLSLHQATRAVSARKRKIQKCYQITLPVKVVPEGTLLGWKGIFPSAVPLLWTLLPWALPVGL